MSVWFNTSVTIEQLQSLGHRTLGGLLGMEFTEIGDNFLKMRMPVDDRTRQPYGLLHGGASAALAETVGSVASSLVIDPAVSICVGLELNANHIRGVSNGFVHATATPLHLGQSTHVWDIRIVDDQQKLICVSRLTVSILRKR